MISFVKPTLFAGLSVGCLALSGGAQTPAPTPPPPATPATVAAPAAVYQATPALAGQGGYRGLAATVSGDRVIYAYGHSAADVEALKLARQIADAKTDEDKDKLRDKMQDVLSKAFEEKQKQHEKQIEALEAQVKKLREMVSKRSKNKRDIIDERIKQLEREATGLGW